MIHYCGKGGDVMSILGGVKSYFGLNSQEDDGYDSELITYINGCLGTLEFVGAIHSAPMITGYDEEWDSISDDKTLIELMKNYVNLSVKILFDPPSSTQAVEAIKRTIDRYEYQCRIKGGD